MTTNELAWYVAHTRPRCEKKLASKKRAGRAGPPEAGRARPVASVAPATPTLCPDVLAPTHTSGVFPGGRVAHACNSVQIGRGLAESGNLERP